LINMNLHKIAGFGAIALLASAPILWGTPVGAEFLQVSQSLVENLQQEPQVKLQLIAEKQVTTTDAQGQPQLTWQSIGGNEVEVTPGDVLRYTLTGANDSDRAVKDLEITQPIPQQTAYVLESATVADIEGAEVTYSIDGGQTFVAEPTVEVTLPDGTVEERPAPAEMYTHIRWNMGETVDSGVAMNATYQVAVR
jgi:uncharacterized repeat protein (TIGR01451 family)